MWDNSQLRLALGNTGANAYQSGDAKSTAASTDVGESLENGEQDRSPLGAKGAVQQHKAASHDGYKRFSGESESHKELQALQKEYMILLQQNEGLRDQVSAKDKELQRAYDQIETLQSPAEKEDVDSMAKQLQDFAAQNSELALEISKLSKVKSEAETFRQCNEASDVTIKKLTEKLRDLQNDLDSTRDELEKTRHQAAEAESQVTALEKARARSPNELEDSLMSVSSELATVKDSLTQCSQEKDALEAKLSELYENTSGRMYMGLFGGMTSTLIVGGLYQLCAWGRKR